MGIRRTDLASGLVVVSEAIAGSRSASFGCWVRVGSRDELAGEAGVSHFLEHLVFKGTPTRSGREISEAVEAVGGEFNAHTAHEHTAFYSRVPASAADVGLGLLVEVLTAPGFDDDDVDCERQVILEELHQAEDEGDDRVHSLAHESLWGPHPLGREVAGEPATIEVLDAEAIKGFFADRYVARNVVLVAAGAVDHDALVEAGEVFCAAGDAGGDRRAAPDPAQPVVSTAVLRRPMEQAHLAIAWPALSVHDPDRFALAILNQIFGGGLSSRLFQEIREDRGLAYSVFSSVSAYQDAGSLIAYAGTSPDRVAKVRRLILDEAASIASDGVTEREWEVARGYLEGSTLLGLEDSASVMARLGNQMCARGEVAPLDDQLERLRAVTPADVQRVAARILEGTPAVCGVGPIDEGDLSG